jgi:hypothetical protein
MVLAAVLRSLASLDMESQLGMDVVLQLDVDMVLQLDVEFWHQEVDLKLADGQRARGRRQMSPERITLTSF